ncbi:MAG: ABC transporter permease, partial [Muribaculaceae bacterium]|nr:ABC transporter permease [Muribaculaceae bacterium]
MSLSSGGKKKAPAVAVAVAAVALSVGVMLASISIVLGFKKEIRDKVIGFNSHISLFVTPTTSDEDNIIALTPSLMAELDSVPFITDYSLQAAIPAILKTSTDFKGVYLKGVAGEQSGSFLFKNMEEGQYVDFNDPENKSKIIISRAAAKQLNLKTGDKIDTYFISDDVRVRRLEIAGIFNTHFDQYDDVMIFGSLALIQQLGGINENQGTSLQIFTDDFDNIQEYTIDLQHRLNAALADGRIFRLYRVDNAYNQGINFFSWLSLLDTNVVVVLVLMMIVGCVTLVSGMLIIIIEKKRFIGIMKALGAPTSKIRSIFVWLAIKIALWGM